MKATYINLLALAWFSTGRPCVHVSRTTNPICQMHIILIDMVAYRAEHFKTVMPHNFTQRVEVNFLFPHMGGK